MNATTRFTLSTFTATSLLAAFGMAHPPEESTSYELPARVWTNQRTGELVQGRFLAARGSGEVTVQRQGGGVAVVPFEDLAPADQEDAAHHIAAARAINEQFVAAAIGLEEQPATKPAAADTKPSQAAIFTHFMPFVKTRWDGQWLYVESDGMPHAPAEHPMMAGIKAWQQQIPLPQEYTGHNAWQIPLKPELSDTPVSGKTELRRGAVALAANGIPIFNALNNRGDDAFLVGELDEFGGHSGRADDYHYHIAPLVLQKVVGKGQPIGYALDGFPLYGLFDPAAKKGDDLACSQGGTEKLDQYNGHFGLQADGTKGPYHYHASKTYPYINGGVRGKVTVKEDQIDPQPRATPMREAGTPLRGASIVSFKTLGPKSWTIDYLVNGQKYTLNYRLEGGQLIFERIDPQGKKTEETFTRRQGGGQGGGGGNGGGRGRRDDQRQPRDDQRPPRDGQRQPRDDRRPPRDDQTPPPPREDGGEPREGGDRQPRRQAALTGPSRQPSSSGFSLISSAIAEDGKLPAEFTCDGASIAPPLAWSKAPAGTKSFAITMHHIPGPPRPGEANEDKHVYIVLYDIPATTTSLPKGSTTIGTHGINTVNRRTEYAPPCSQGPGEKKYTLTIYALSAAPEIKVPGRQVTMDVLLAAIKDRTLDHAVLDITYERPR